MRTTPSTHRLAALGLAGLFTTLLAGGCITHPPDGQQKVQDKSKETRTVRRHKQSITHPPDSKDSPAPGNSKPPPPPADITHPGE